MGVFPSRSPNTFESVSYEVLCDALTKWYGKPASYAHCINVRSNPMDKENMLLRPKWMGTGQENDEYLDDLSTSFFSEVIQWKVCAMFAEGQTYAELMLKIYPRNDTRSRTFRSTDFFKNEITFYEKILPRLLDFQNSKEITGKFENHVKLCFTHWGGKNDLICFGDSRVDGYLNAKENVLDLEHGKLILKTSKFHALSFALKIENPEIYEALSNEISETYYNERFWSWYTTLWSQICSVAITAVEKEYPESIYANKVREFATPSKFKDLIRAVKDRENSVILHGDCRASNYLFKYNDDRPVDVKIVDFQQVRCSSPALDVSSILYTNRELLNDFDGLLKYYYGNLAIRIKELGINPSFYTFDMFMEEVRKYSFFGLAFSLEAACTKLTAEDVTNKVCYWIQQRIDQTLNIADAYDVKNLEDQDRSNLAYNVVHCVDNGYI